MYSFDNSADAGASGMRAARHIRRALTGAAAFASLLVVVISVQLALAQDPEDPILPEPDLLDGPGDVGYGIERPAVQGEQEDCDIDPGDARCPPPPPYSIARPVATFSGLIVSLQAAYRRVTWLGSENHAYIFELHRSTTATGTFRRSTSIWDRDREVDFFSVGRGYYYKIRAKRCRV